MALLDKRKSAVGTHFEAMTDKCEVPNLAAETCKTFLPNFHLENGKPLPKIPPPEDETPERKKKLKDTEVSD